MKRKSIAMLAAALCTLAITVTALAAELINAEQARSIGCSMGTGRQHTSGD